MTIGRARNHNSFKITMNKVFISLIIIGAVGAVATGVTISYFSDTETSSGNTFTAGTLDLKVGDNDPTDWRFDISDIKPGDSGSEEAVLKNAGSISGYLHITFNDLLDEENQCVEPEAETANQSESACNAEGGLWKGSQGGEDQCNCEPPGNDSGELAENLDLLAYIEETGGIAGDFDLGIDTLVYQGKARGILQGDEFNYFLAGGEQRDFRIEWSLDISIGNVVQSDKVGFDIECELTQTPNDVIGDWHFNENAGMIAYDSSGRGNHGTLNGAVWGDGKYNPAMSFDGVDDYVGIPDSAELNIARGSWEMWLKFSAKPSEAGLMNPLAKQEQYWIHGSSDNSLQAKISVNGTRYIAKTSSGFIETDKWYHAVGVYDNADLKLYVNGSLEDSVPIAQGGDIDTTSNILAIGTWSSFVDYFDGLIDEVKIYNRALDADEVLARYNIGQ